MSTTKSSTKDTHTSSKSPAKQTVEVGGGVIDRTTFKTYDIKKGTTVLAAAAEISHEVTNAVYQRYGMVPPGNDDKDVADCWIFRVSRTLFCVTIDTKQDHIADYDMPLSALPPAQPDIPPLVTVLIKLRTDTPMMNRVLAATKKNMDKENNGLYYHILRTSTLNQPTAGTPGDLAVILAEFQAMKKVYLHITSVKTTIFNADFLGYARCEDQQQ
jgi:hypothetical protein